MTTLFGADDPPTPRRTRPTAPLVGEVHVHPLARSLEYSGRWWNGKTWRGGTSCRCPVEAAAGTYEYAAFWLGRDRHQAG